MTAGQGTTDTWVAPQNQDAEIAVLGAMILKPEALDKAAAILRREDFMTPQHGIVFDALANLREDGQPIDPVMLQNELARTGHFEDENDAAKIQQALNPLHPITEAGAGVLLVHHLKKGDAAVGQGSRGSGALMGFVDVIVEFKPYDLAHIRQDKRRVLDGLGRTDETPEELVVELTDDGCRMVGTKAEATQHERLRVVADILEPTQDPMTSDEIRKAWPDNGLAKPSVATMRRDLYAATEKGWFDTTGTGTRGDPVRYANSIRFDSL